MTAGRALDLDVDGVRVHAVEWSAGRAGASGRQVLLVHGLGANTLSWEPVGQRLADRLEATVTAIDLVGFGRTRAHERSASLAANERLVAAFLKSRGPAVVLGNSMGGAIGVRLTAHRPELVDGLVLVDPAVPLPRPGVGDWVRLARLSPMLLPPVGRRVLGTRARLLGPERLVDATLTWCLHDRSRLDPDLRRRLIALAAERYAYPEAAGAYTDAARSLLVYLARGVIDDLSVAADLRPVLLIHGEHDRLVPLAAALAAAAVNDTIDLEVFDGIGHTPQLEDPDRFVAVVGPWVDERVRGLVGGARS